LANDEKITVKKMGKRVEQSQKTGQSSTVLCNVVVGEGAKTLEVINLKGHEAVTGQNFTTVNRACRIITHQCTRYRSFVKDYFSRSVTCRIGLLYCS